jgi:hypothetical protein
MKLLIICGLVLAGMAASASAQSYTTRPPAPKVQPQQQPAPRFFNRDVTGVVPRAVRGGNPVQMLNPVAPARYGTARESVMVDPADPGKWKGIKLFTFLF